MEPALPTAPHLIAVLEELKRREPLFHRPELGTSRRDFEDMTETAFWEVGASGRRYSREFILDTLKNRRPRVTRRATLWRRSVNGWQVLYHQGTVVDPAP
jgi:hypothetical protein